MRIKNSIRNTSFALVGQFLSIILNFISRTIFINILGAEYLGVNGLFSNILSMLSMAELGIGSAIIYNIYKPLANKDEYKISALMNLYAVSYKVIGLIVTIIGLSLIPFLNIIIKDMPNVPHLKLVYIIFVANSASTYFFAYKRSLLIADQKSYIDTINRYKFILIQTIVQMLVLIFTKNYILYLIVLVICNIVSNIIISKQVDDMYEFLEKNKDAKLNSNEKKEIFKHVYAMMSHKVGGVVVNGTDNILISYFLGVYHVGLYSNYVLVTGVINTFLSQIFSSVTASVGNLTAEEDKEKQKNIFDIMFFINAWLYGFCSISLMILLNTFVSLWIGNKYIFDKKIVFIIVINFFIMGMRKSTITFNTTLGLFWNDRYKPWIESAINLIVSIILLNKMGIAGVLLGTLISTIVTSIWIEPYILYKYGFDKKLIDYFKRYAIYTGVIFISGLLTYNISNYFSSITWINLIIKLMICLVIPNLTIILILCRTKEFKYIYDQIGIYIKKVNKVQI